MWFGKNIIAKLGLALALAVPALAAPMGPMYYQGKSSAESQDYWDSLMIFKAWGTNGVIIGGRSGLPDEVGATGTANGPLQLNDNGVVLGGRLLIGGNLENGLNGTGGHTLNSGTARIAGNIDLNNGTRNNFKGIYCVTGTSNVQNGYDVVDGDIYANNAQTGSGQACAADAEKPVSRVFDYLSVPLLDDAGVSYKSEILADGKTVIIDIPPIGENGGLGINNGERLYDIYVDGITVRNGGRIFIRMPYEGGKRLVRFFLKHTISFAGSPRKLQIMYVDKDATYNNGVWTSSKDSVVENKDYAGNLMFYAKDDITWDAFNGGDTLQGSYITRGTFTMGTNLALAGQLISEKLIIPQDFDGSGFRYVQFDNPVVKLEPTANGDKKYLAEGHDKDTVHITLDKNATVGISFDYCFEFKGAENSLRENDGDTYANEKDFTDTGLPLYNSSEKKCASTKQATFADGKTYLDPAIVLHVYDDDLYEDDLESFKIWIENLKGATLESGARDGYLELFIKDNDGKPFGQDVAITDGIEDVPYKFEAFTVTNASGTVLTNYSVKIETLPAAGSLVLVGDDGKDVKLKKGDVVSSSAIDKNTGKFIFRFDENDYTGNGDPNEALDRYNFEFRVIDATIKSESENVYTASVMVAPVNDKPKAESTEFTIAENSADKQVAQATGAINVSDVDFTVDANGNRVYDVLTYTFDLTADVNHDADYYAHVADLYNIDPATGKISVKKGTVLNYESADSLLEIKVKITDDGHTTAADDDALDTTVVVTIRMIDVNESPTVDDPTFTIPENLGNDKVVGEVVGKDPDSLNQHGFEHLEYFIDPANTVANAAFKIVDPTSGVITVKDSKRLDYETVTDHMFVFDVLVRNCEYDATKKTYTANCLEDVRSHVTVELTDEPEPPEIIPKCQGDECPTICQGDKCEVCQGESCNEVCVENCDKPHDPIDVLTVSVKENSKNNYEVMRYLVRDEDFGHGHTTALNAKIKSAVAVAEKIFDAKMVKDDHDDWNVVVFVKDSTELDYEKLDSDKNFKVTIYVYDDEDGGLYGSLPRVIQVDDVNEAPDITGADIDLPENTPAGDTIATLAVTDPDKNPLFRRLKYEVVEDPTNPVPFRMDSNNVVVTKTLNYEKDSIVYSFQVAVTDITDETLTDTAWVTIHLKNVNEKPTIIIDDGPDGRDDSDSNCVAHCGTTNRGVWKDSILTIGVRENLNNPDGTTMEIVSPTDMVLFVYHYADEDTGDVAKDSVFWFDTLTTIPSVSTKGTDLFKLDYKNGTITVSVRDEKLLDYEKLRGADSLCKGLTAPECKIPDPEYTIGIVVRDSENGRLADTLYRTIRIIDMNEKPLFTVEPCVIVEGNHPGAGMGHVEHPSDVDSLSRNPDLYTNIFNMTATSDSAAGKFALGVDSAYMMKVVLKALDSIDCENGRYICGVDTVYWVELTYGDPALNTVYTDRRIPITILDRNEAPIIKTDTIGVDENSPKGTPVDSIRWFDYDVFDKEGLHFEISSDPSGCFEIDPKTGFVTVKKDKCSALDHEKNPTLEIEVSVTDMVYVTDASMISGGPNTVKKTIKVNVHDVNEPPHLDDTTFVVSEFTKPGSVIDTVVGHDPDTRNPEFSKLTYSMVKGDSTKFKVDSITGEIFLLDSLDYETKNEYKINVRVYDGKFSDMATITIKVTNEIEKTHVRITMVDDSAKVWNDPEVIYTNNPGREICWEQERDTVCQDIHITKDTVVTITYKNPKKDSAGVDKVIIYYSNAAPVVTISAKKPPVTADNIFTILEKTGDSDSTIYVNGKKNNIYISIRDTANKNSKVNTDTSVAIVLNTDPIESKVYDKVESIIKAGVYLDETKPSKEVTRVPTNGNTVKVSYKEAVGKDTVTVTYETDKNGEVLKSKVIGDDGKEHSWEVITVSYVTKVKINGKEENVTISYQADAATGQVLEQDAEGNLMTATAAEAKRKDAKKNAAKADSSKSKNETTVSDFSTGRFSIAYSYTVEQYVAGELITSSVDVSYVVDAKGELTKNADGDRGYSVKYTYTNIFGNAAEQSLFIVYDEVAPRVEIRSPVDYQEIRSNYVNVEWYVNGKLQDTLTVQGLEKGVNMIVRFYRDKAGNEASDTVFVVMKDSKDIELSVVNPVTEINPDKVAEYYSGENAKFAPEPGQTYSVSILTTSEKEIETLKGGSFDAKAAGGNELYPGQKQKHLGPTLGLKVQLPVVKPDTKSGTVSGLATMDDLMCHGKINLEEVCNENTKTMGVEEYVAKYCDADVSASDELSTINLYNSRLTVKIWIYTSLGGFVDYYRFSHDLNEPDYTNEAGMLQMFFELKPDKEGFVKSESGKLYSTGAYLYKIDASVNSVPRCDVMPMKASSHKRGEKIKSSDELLKPFGYKRPKHR